MIWFVVIGLGLLALASSSSSGPTFFAKDLTPDTKEFLGRLLRGLAAVGIQARVSSTVRSVEEQHRHFQAGRSAIPTAGYHGFGRAFHLTLRDPTTGVWDTKASNRELYGKMHALVRVLGGVTHGYRLIGTSKGGFTDPMHVEFRGGKNLAQLRREHGVA